MLVEEVTENQLLSSFKEHVSILEEDYASQPEKYRENLAKSIDFTERTLREITEDTTLTDFYFAQRIDEDGEPEMIIKHQDDIIGKVFSSGGGLGVVMSFSVDVTESQIGKIEAISSTVKDLNARKIYLGKKKMKGTPELEYNQMQISFSGVPTTPDRYEEGEYEPTIKKQVIPAFKMALSNPGKPVY